MPRSKRSYAAAATRAANVLFAKRSAAAKKGWATRRAHQAADVIRRVLRKPGGRNKRRGKVEPYRVQKYGYTFRGQRYDFRGLNKAQIRAMRDRVLQDSVGHYVRMLAVTTNEEMYRRLTTSGSRDIALHLRRHESGKPFWFWTSEYGPISSTLEMYEQFLGILDDTDKQVKIVMVEIL